MQRGLLEVPGVIEATVDWENGRAEVSYDPYATTPDALIQAKIFAREWMADDGVARHQYGARLDPGS